MKKISLREWLVKNGIPINVFANAVGVRPNSVSRWLAGGSAPTRHTRRLIRELTGNQVDIDLDDILPPGKPNPK